MTEQITPRSIDRAAFGLVDDDGDGYGGREPRHPGDCPATLSYGHDTHTQGCVEYTPASHSTTDASLVFLARRALTMQLPGQGVYHLPRAWTYGSVTRCGIVIWANDQRETRVLPIRRDTAERIAHLCGRCEVDH